MAHNILVVDDMLINRKLIKSVLKHLEHTTFYDAEDGFEAIKEVEDKEIDLIILDLMMPGKDGFQVLTELKGDPRYQEIPIIVYSAMDGIDSINQALELGAYDYFTKPLTVQQMKFILPAKVKNALESYSQRKQIMQMHERMKLEMMLANMFQQTLMTAPPEHALLSVYHKYLPSQEVGGNFYDCLAVGNDFWFIMADTSAHGVSAAMVSAMVKVEFNVACRTLATPGAVLQHMNDTFYRIMQGDYTLNAVIGCLSGRTLTYANAGHVCPLHYNIAVEKVDVLEGFDPAVGQFSDMEYVDHTIALNKNDYVLLYTEGLFESRLQYDNDMNYEDLGSYFLSYKHIIADSPDEFFNVLLRLFGGVTDENVNRDISLLLLKIQ